MNNILGSYALPQQDGEIKRFYSTYDDFLLFHVFQSLENGLCYVTWFIIKKCEYYKNFTTSGLLVAFCLQRNLTFQRFI